MHLLKGLNGVAYSCSSDVNTYCDDWYTLDYKNVYDNSKKSLQRVKGLGYNIVRTYYLNPDNDHEDFLNLCDSLGLAVEIGISNDILDDRDSQKISKIIRETLPHKCVKLYTVGNEYFNDVSNIIWGIQTVYDLDNSRNIMHSSIFDEGFATAKRIYQAVHSSIK